MRTTINDPLKSFLFQNNSGSSSHSSAGFAWLVAIARVVGAVTVVFASSGRSSASERQK